MWWVFGSQDSLADYVTADYVTDARLNMASAKQSAVSTCTLQDFDRDGHRICICGVNAKVADGLELEDGAQGG